MKKFFQPIYQRLFSGRIKNIVYSFFIMLFVISGTACVQQNTLPTASTDISQSITDAQNADEKVNIENKHNSSLAHNYVLSLIEDNNDALLNGESITLLTPPLVQNGTFYMPLEAVTKLLGGTYSFENDIATIELFGNTTKYKIGSRSITINGETYVVSGSREFFGKRDFSGDVAIDEKYVPVVSSGTVFIPINFTTPRCPYNGINAARGYPESRMAILGDFENEWGINEVKLKDSYDDLPASFRSQLQYSGIAGEVINFNIEKYKNDDVEVFVTRIKKSQKDVDDMDGRVCAIKAAGNRYSTPRGLKTGDSAYRAWRLYGYEDFTRSFFYKVNGGIVSSFTFYTNYYGSQL